MTKRPTLIFIGLLLASAALAACSGQAGGTSATAPPTPAFSAQQLTAIVQSTFPLGGVATPCAAASSSAPGIYLVSCQQNEQFFVNPVTLQWSAANQDTATIVQNYKIAACNSLHECGSSSYSVPTPFVLPTVTPDTFPTVAPYVPGRSSLPPLGLTPLGLNGVGLKPLGLNSGG